MVKSYFTETSNSRQTFVQVDTGTFENVIRIGQNPLIILRGDELITVRCFYGPPEIVTPALPEQVNVRKQPLGLVA